MAALHARGLSGAPPVMSLDHRFLLIPFRAGGRDEKGCDCWGLFRLVFEHLTGIALPSYAAVPTGVAHAEAETIRAALASDDWRPVEAPEALAGVLMDARQEIGGKWVRLPNHVGLMLDANRIIHTTPEGGASVVPLTHPSFRRIKIRGFFRHKAFA